MFTSMSLCAWSVMSTNRCSSGSHECSPHANWRVPLTKWHQWHLKSVVDHLCALVHHQQLCHIDCQAEGGIPSYSFALMVIFFLQQRKEPILPVYLGRWVSLSRATWLPLLSPQGRQQRRTSRCRERRGHQAFLAWELPRGYSAIRRATVFLHFPHVTFYIIHSFIQLL